PLQRINGGDSTLRAPNIGLRLRPVVAAPYRRPVFRHKPIRLHVRRSVSDLSPYPHQQPLRDELPIHRRRQSSKDRGHRRPRPLDEIVEERQPRVDDHRIFSLHNSQHAGRGRSSLGRHVRRILWKPHDSGGGNAIHRMGNRRINSIFQSRIRRHLPLPSRHFGDRVRDGRRRNASRNGEKSQLVKAVVGATLILRTQHREKSTSTLTCAIAIAIAIPTTPTATDPFCG
ncbi:hypothetical protein U1Q18_046386, partial [Sarracenia purpurea var. burkii]